MNNTTNTLSAFNVRAYVDLDCCADPNEYAAKFAVTATVVEETGPAGWPLVRFEGPIDAIATLVEAYENE